MFRILSSVAQKLPSVLPAVSTIGETRSFLCSNFISSKLTIAAFNRNLNIFSKYNLNTLNHQNSSALVSCAQSNFLKPNHLLVNKSRSLTKFSLIKGKRKSVKCVLKRFKRLDWGIWIRTRSGCHKKKFKKSAALKRRLNQHVFVNATQSWLLDSMVTKYWRKPKYYIDDPYEQYHKREEYFATRKKPLNFTST